MVVSLARLDDGMAIRMLEVVKGHHQPMLAADVVEPAPMVEFVTHLIPDAEQPESEGITGHYFGPFPLGSPELKEAKQRADADFAQRVARGY